MEMLSPQDEENRLVWTDDLLKPTSRPIPTPTSSHVVPPPTPSVRKCPKCGTEVTGTANLCSICGCYVGGGKRDQEEQEKSRRSFQGDLIHLISPVHSIGDGIKLFFLLILGILMNAPVFGWFMLLGKIIACGYWCAYMFSVVVETADGSDELPDFPGITDFWEDVLHPLLLWIASFIYACLPFVVTLIYLAVRGIKFGGGLDDMSMPVVLIGTAVAGLFFWPMILLCMALGESLASARPDLVVRSIIGTFIPYLVCCVCLYGCAFAWYMSFVVLAGSQNDTLGRWLLLAIASQAGGMCLWLYAMRTMGLLYRHYQNKLVW